MKLSNILFPALFIAAAVLCAVSCQEDDDVAETGRLFRPTLNGDIVAQGNRISVAWQNIKAAASYTAEISRDTFKTIDQSVEIDTNAIEFEDLEWSTLYQIQVKANAGDAANDSRMSNLGSAKTEKFPTILITPVLSDLSDVGVRVRWQTSGEPVTSIRVLSTPDNTLLQEITLTPADVAAGERVIDGLTPLTTYRVELYSNTTIRGYDNYSTKASVKEGDNIIDLTGITGKPGILADTILDVASGSTIVLKRGEIYNIASAVNLDRSVTIISDLDLNADPASIYFTSNFNFLANSVVDSVVFRDVHLYSDNYTSRYVFNVSNPCTIGRISFQNCHAEIFRGLVRLQTAVINVTGFEVANSTLDSLSNYGVLAVDNVNCKVNTVKIYNSTLYKLEKVITSKQNSQSVVLENCTFNEAPLGGNFFIDYNGVAVESPVKFVNCILGTGKSNAGNVDVKGFRLGSGSVDVSGTYATSDYVSTTVANQLPGLIAYSGKSTALWVAPRSGIFYFKDTTFSGKSKAGDTRWRP